MGNLYNVQQVVGPNSTTKMDVSKSGLNKWNIEVRKHVMKKLRRYAPEQVDKIIKATFGNFPPVSGL